MELFDRFDRVQYNNFELTNILRRVKPIKQVLERINVYHKYTIKEGERADTIAHDYYNDSTYAWLVYIANDIYDPYYQWPLTHPQMFNYLTRKYGDYYQTQVDIKHFKNDSYDFTVSPFTFDQWTQEQRVGWYSQTIYDWEDEENEKKRYIKLVSNRYLDQINQQVSALFN